MKLTADSLVKRYGKRTVVNGVSVEVNPGEIVGLLGPNGAGKTTTFYMVLGLVRPNGGSVHLDGQDITPLPTYQRARLGIGYLPQEPSVFRRLSVEDNLRAILQMLGLSEQEQEARLNQALEEFHVAHLRRAQGIVLSGGERRRVEIARALVIQPTFLLLDEPFSGIDPIQVLELQRIIFDLKRSGIGILMTDHNVRETLAVTDRAYIINNGQIFRSGTPEALGNDPEVKRVYLGEGFNLTEPRAGQ
jgi:lipopolysaccharide export system ATP-binding protein